MQSESLLTDLKKLQLGANQIKFLENFIARTLFYQEYFMEFPHVSFADMDKNLKLAYIKRVLISSFAAAFLLLK